MKKTLSGIFLLTLCLLVVFSFTGCGVIYDAFSDIVAEIQGEDGPGQVRKRAEAVRNEYSETMIECFKTGNAEKLKAVFCPKTQEIHDIGEQIEQGFAFIEGNITEYAVSPEMNGEGMGVDYGVVTLYEGYGSIYTVKTDAGKWYEIYFHMYYVIRDENRKGVTWLTICDTQNTMDYDSNPECYEDDTYFYIGYAWNESYEYDASCLAHDAIKAISDGDPATLKGLFCRQALENDEMEAQMQAAFTFFNGNATFGESKRKNDSVYDGHHDFRNESLNDKVLIENDREVSVYVEVFTVNIETDAGKIYEMKWAAYLKNEQAPDSAGILYLTLIDGDEKVTIGTSCDADVLLKCRAV